MFEKFYKSDTVPKYKNASINSVNDQNDEALWCASSLQPGQDKPTYTGNDCPAE